jgi:pseudaminic acid cytidylyltransferase
MNVAVIPARGGSKRIPRKNVRPFAGRPLIEHAIETARASGCFDSILVSTDDAQIASIAAAAGARVPFTRPAELSDDFTGTIPVIRHAVQWLVEHGEPPEFVCCLYPAAVLLEAAALADALAMLRTSGREFCFGAVAYAHPIQRAIVIEPGGAARMLDPDQALRRTQDLQPAFHDAGQFYWGRADAFLRGGSPLAEGAAALVLPRSRVVDIDTEDDWQLAEALHAALGGMRTSTACAVGAKIQGPP